MPNPTETATPDDPIATLLRPPEMSLEEYRRLHDRAVDAHALLLAIASAAKRFMDAVEALHQDASNDNHAAVDREEESLFVALAAAEAKGVKLP